MIVLNILTHIGVVAQSKFCVPRELAGLYFLALGKVCVIKIRQTLHLFKGRQLCTVLQDGTCNFEYFQESEGWHLRSYTSVCVRLGTRGPLVAT